MKANGVSFSYKTPQRPISYCTKYLFKILVVDGVSPARVKFSASTNRNFRISQFCRNVPSTRTKKTSCRCNQQSIVKSRCTFAARKCNSSCSSRRSASCKFSPCRMPPPIKPYRKLNACRATKIPFVVLIIKLTRFRKNIQNHFPNASCFSFSFPNID